MPFKSFSSIALILLVPLAVLIVLATRTFSIEHDAISAQRELLAKQRVDAAGQVIASRLQSFGATELADAQAAYAVGGSASLSAKSHRGSLLYAFAFRGGEMVGTLLAQEHQYDRTRLMGDNAQALAASINSDKRSAMALVADSGSFALLSCARSTSEDDLCIVVAQARVMAELRAALVIAAQTAGLAHTGLSDPSGAVVALDSDSRVSTTAYPLQGLMSGWQLRGDEELLSLVNAPQPERYLYLAIGTLLAGWATMTWMLHRSAVLDKELASARTNVVAHLAHELRTPLANLKLHAELLHRKASDPVAIARYSEVLESEIDRLAGLAENAITVARGASAQPRLEEVAPDDCLTAILERFGPTLLAARCDVSVDLNAGHAVIFDRASWERCVVNLIDNARKYAAGSPVRISTAFDGDLLRLDVADQGPGINSSQHAQIFEPWRRGTTANAGGFGLGLAAVRTLARQNGGDCWVRAIDAETRFVLTFETKPADRRALRAQQHNDLDRGGRSTLAAWARRVSAARRVSNDNG